MWLNMMEAEVRGFSLEPPTTVNFYELLKIAQKIDSIHGDVTDFTALQKSIFEFQPDIVIHMAAKALVRQSYTSPVETYSTNIMGTVNLLESVRQVKSVKAVINVTSDKCYENKNCLRRYKENDPMGGFDPYSSSKGCSELITSAYTRSFFQEDSSVSGTRAVIASARAGNVIGGGDFATDRLIPDMVKAFLNRYLVDIRQPDAIRPWQHVLEPLFGYLLLARKLYEHGKQFAGPWNFGPDEKGLKNVGYLADKFTEMWGNNVGWRHDQLDHPHESIFLGLDASKARELLGWYTIWDIDQALTYTADWYKCFRDGAANLPTLTKVQINDYEKQFDICSKVMET